MSRLIDMDSSEKHGPVEIFFAKIMIALFIVFLAFVAGKYYWEKKIEKDLFEIRQKSAKHIKIDEIDNNNGIYLILLNEDTMGVVSVKEK